MEQIEWRIRQHARKAAAGVLAVLMLYTIPASGAGQSAAGPGQGGLSAKIELPRPGKVTGNWIAVDGTVGGSSARRPWLALRVADLYWPKEEAIVQDGRLRGVVIEVVSRDFEIVVLDAPPAVSARFRAWLEE
jgi:hypothetical protein